MHVTIAAKAVTPPPGFGLAFADAKALAFGFTEPKHPRQDESRMV